MSATVHEFPHKHLLTVDEYLRMGAAGIFKEEARIELIEGEIIDMAPIGTWHASIVNRLAEKLIVRLQGVANVSIQAPVVLYPHSMPQPDLAVVRKRADAYVSAHPAPADIHLLIEVADSTLAFDREVKLPLYARLGIPETWLIDIPNRQCLRFSDPLPSGYRQQATLTGLGQVALPGMSNIWIDLSDLFPAHES
jgi:Uma2 family endonuclease